jgi:hypothetical protein
MDRFGLIHGHLICLQQFGIFYGPFGIFYPVFGILYQEKSGNPESYRLRTSTVTALTARMRILWLLDT